MTHFHSCNLYRYKWICIQFTFGCSSYPPSPIFVFKVTDMPPMAVEICIYYIISVHVVYIHTIMNNNMIINTETTV